MSPAGRSCLVDLALVDLALKVVSKSADVQMGEAQVRHRIRQEREERRTSLLPVRIRGCDTKGNVVSQVACTLNVSRGGTRLVGLQRRLKVGSMVWLRYHQEEGRFKVVWARRDGKPGQWQAGLCCMEAADRFWAAELGCGLEPENCRQLLKQALGEL
jgi:hypothetical protein